MSSPSSSSDSLFLGHPTLFDSFDGALFDAFNAARFDAFDAALFDVFDATLFAGKFGWNFSLSSDDDKEEGVYDSSSEFMVVKWMSNSNEMK